MIMKESIMHYLVLKILQDKDFEYNNGRKMLDAWMKAKDLFESMSQKERDEIENEIKKMKNNEK